MILFRSSGRLLAFILTFSASVACGPTALEPAAPPHYGAHILLPGFAPAPFSLDALSGGDVAIKPLALGDNCLGYAAAEPDILLELAAPFPRITLLAASQTDTTLIVRLPNGGWTCNDDANGLNPALVLHNAAPGMYLVWIGNYAAGSHDEAVFYVSELGPESLPTTATGPDPEREASYGKATLAPRFQPAPFAVQVLGGGRSPAADFLAEPGCHGYIAEAPDYSVALGEPFREIHFGLHSPAAMTLIIHSADGKWHCSETLEGRDAAISFSHAPAGEYDIWAGSADFKNYSASILYVSESPARPPDLRIDANCPSLPATELNVSEIASVVLAHATMYDAPETASTLLYRPEIGAKLRLIGGPVCKDGLRWWRAELVESSQPVRGWIADGGGNEAWLQPAD